MVQLEDQDLPKKIDFKWLIYDNYLWLNHDWTMIEP